MTSISLLCMDRLPDFCFLFSVTGYAISHFFFWSPYSFVSSCVISAPNAGWIHSYCSLKQSCIFVLCFALFSLSGSFGQPPRHGQHILKNRHGESFFSLCGFNHLFSPPLSCFVHVLVCFCLTKYVSLTGPVWPLFGLPWYAFNAAAELPAQRCYQVWVTFHLYNKSRWWFWGF